MIVDSLKALSLTRAGICRSRGVTLPVGASLALSVVALPPFQKAARTAASSLGAVLGPSEDSAALCGDRNAEVGAVRNEGRRRLRAYGWPPCGGEDEGVAGRSQNASSAFRTSS